MFTEKEREYLANHTLARIGTVASGGQVDVAPVMYKFDLNQFLIGGHRQLKSFKYKNVYAGQILVGLVIDDVDTTQGWEPNGIKIHGTAEIIDGDLPEMPGPLLRITPDTHWSWGINRPVFEDGKPLAQKPVRWTRT
jgi:PPOX class F420-dependent enzyme/OxyR family protein